MPVAVSVLGHFGDGLDLLNGQTIKTKIITRELQRQLGPDQVLTIDTHGGWRTLLKAPFQALRALRRSANVLIFPAHNGLRIYAPLLCLLRRFFQDRRLHYVVIGGWLPQFLQKRRGLARVLRTFDGVYVETNTMKNALEAQGFSNVLVMPNCKNLTILSPTDLIYPSDLPYRLCTFSRVMKEKGIETAVEAVRQVNEALGYTGYCLDIYGQVDSAQTEWFEALQKQFPSYIQYGGVVSFEESVDVLKHYFALLFPTYYEGEGFAGTLIDAFCAGLPVISSDWKYNAELVNDAVGYIYPTFQPEALTDILKALAIDPEQMLLKKHVCLEEAKKYSTDVVIQIILKRLIGVKDEE